MAMRRSDSSQECKLNDSSLRALIRLFIQTNLAVSDLFETIKAIHSKAINWGKRLLQKSLNGPVLPLQSSNGPRSEVSVGDGLGSKTVNLFDIENSYVPRCLNRLFNLPVPEPEQPLSCEASQLLETIPNADLLAAY